MSEDKIPNAGARAKVWIACGQVAVKVGLFGGGDGLRAIENIEEDLDTVKPLDDKMRRVRDCNGKPGAKRGV